MDNTLIHFEVHFDIMPGLTKEQSEEDIERFKAFIESRFPYFNLTIEATLPENQQ